MASGREGSREAYSVRDDSRDATRWTGRTELPIANDDLIGGKLENPVPIDNTSKTLITPDQRDKQVAIHTDNIDGLPDTGGTTTVTPIPQGPSQDDLSYLSLKGKEAQQAAEKLGFDRKIAPTKAPFDSHGQSVFFNGKTCITPDVDSHNVTDGWKMFDRRGKRLGTCDESLNRIKD